MQLNIKASSQFCFLLTVLKLSCCVLIAAAIPHPNVTELSFIPSTKPRDTDPPEVILSFNVSVAPPTYVTCQVDGTPVDVAVLSHEVAASKYLPPSTASPVTNVTVTLRTRQAGNYQCTVSVFRASMVEGDTNALTSPETSPITILGQITMTQSVNHKEKSYCIMFLTVTGTPTNIMSVRPGDYTVKLSWSSPASNTPSVAGYEVFYAVSGSDVTHSGGITTFDTTTISVTLPNQNAMYDFFVVAFSNADNALPSARSSNTTINLSEFEYL